MVLKASVFLQGGGGHAKVVIDALKRSGHHVVGVFDPRFTSGELMGVPLKGTYDASLFSGAKCVLAIGNNEQRRSAVEHTRHQFATVVDSTAILATDAEVGEGSMILHGAIIQPFARLGKHVIVNTAASIDHDCVIGDFVHVAPGSRLCGNVSIGEGTLVGAGAVLLPGVRIGKWCVVGAGSVVTKDVQDGATVAGNPAKVIKGK